MSIQTTDNPRMTAVDGGLIGALSLVWGSSYLLIAIGLDSLTPGVVAWGRVALGAAVLWLFPAARITIDRQDWWRIGIVAVAGNAGPAILFATAELTVESAVVGLLTAATPLLILVLAVALGTKNLRAIHYSGLLVGFAGLVLMAIPSLNGVDAPVGGILMILLAVTGYAITANVVVPLQRKYGGTAVIARALLISAVVLGPVGFAGLEESSFAWPSVIAVVVLGVLGTGLARMMSANLNGRAGAARASVIGYLIPVVAVVLGVAFRDETVSSWELFGLGLALLGAFLGSRPVKELDT